MVRCKKRGACFQGHLYEYLFSVGLTFFSVRQARLDFKSQLLDFLSALWVLSGFSISLLKKMLKRKEVLILEKTEGTGQSV